MKTIALAVVLAAASFVVPIACAEDKVADVTDMQALRAAVRSDKRAFVASTLNLTDAEGKRFWPIYDAYQRNVDAMNRRRVVAVEGLLFRDTPMTALAAKNVTTELMSVEDVELKARKTLRNRVMRALPPIKAARYLQLEDKIHAVQDYDIASVVPLIR